MVGQRWDDGCAKTCECLDENTGLYQCRDRSVYAPLIKVSHILNVKTHWFIADGDIDLISTYNEGRKCFIL